MTSSKWKISEAKARFSEVVGACEEEPQVLYNRGKPVAAIIGMERFTAFQRFQEEENRPTMAALLDELEQINEGEADFGEAPPRVDRPQPELD